MLQEMATLARLRSHRLIAFINVQMWSCLSRSRNFTHFSGGLSFKISTTKLTAPTVTPNKTSSQLMHRPLISLRSVLRDTHYLNQERPRRRTVRIPSKLYGCCSHNSSLSAPGKIATIITTRMPENAIAACKSLPNAIAATCSDTTCSTVTDGCYEQRDDERNCTNVRDLTIVTATNSAVRSTCCTQLRVRP